MKKDMVRESQEKDVSEMSFVERYQKDSKYKAKVQLVGYGVFLIILIVYLNIASMNSKPVENRVLSDERDVLEKDNTSKELNDWIKKLGSNYEYAIEVMIKNEEEEDQGQEGMLWRKRAQSAYKLNAYCFSITSWSSRSALHMPEPSKGSGLWLESSLPPSELPFSKSDTFYGSLSL